MRQFREGPPTDRAQSGKRDKGKANIMDDTHTGVIQTKEEKIRKRQKKVRERKPKVKDTRWLVSAR